MMVFLIALGACNGSKATTEPDAPAPAATQPAVEAPVPEAPKPLTEHDAPIEPGAGPDTPDGPKMCGGIAGFRCDAGMTCTDDPRDTCDPRHGGRDCSGICVSCEDESLGREYSSRDPAQCRSMDLKCDAGKRIFSDGCGCGCA